MLKPCEIVLISTEMLVSRRGLLRASVKTSVAIFCEFIDINE